MCNNDFDVLAALPRLPIPLFGVYGAADPLVNIETATRFFDGLHQSDKRMLVLARDRHCSADYSHVDLLFGRNGADEVFQPITEWLAAHPIER
jgi:esterase/lipase